MVGKKIELERALHLHLCSFGRKCAIRLCCSYGLAMEGSVQIKAHGSTVLAVKGQMTLPGEVLPLHHRAKAANSKVRQVEAAVVAEHRAGRRFQGK